MTTLRHLSLISAFCLSSAFLGLTLGYADDATPKPAVPAEAAPASPAQAAPAETPANPPADSQAQTPAPGASEAAESQVGKKVDVADLMSPGPLPEIAMGDEKAPVTIVEYHSMTCPHCAHFEETVLPTLTEKYINAGKVRLIMRSFPLNQLDAVAFMLLRCQPTDKYLANVKYLYDTQPTWAYSDHPKEAVTAMATKIGFTQESFDACLHNQTIWDGLLATAKKAEETFKVDGTPTFFVNGTNVGPIGSVEDLDKALAPFVKS